MDSSLHFAYLLYRQSGCFIRPAHLSTEDLLDGLRRFDDSDDLIEHFDPRTSVQLQRGKIFEFLMLGGLIFSTAVFGIDLHRQIFILAASKDPERSLALTLIVYLVDSALLVLIFIERISLGSRWKSNRVLLGIDLLSSTGILLYFFVQRPVTRVVVSPGNVLWMFIHLCRSARLAQLGLHLIEIRWCLQAMSRSLRSFGQTLVGLGWFFLFSGAFLFAIDRLEGNEQYPTMFTAILSAHETLYAIGYRNNAPFGQWTRLWTLISIFGLSSLVQMFLWSFQRRVTTEWKKIIDTQRSITIR